MYTPLSGWINLVVKRIEDFFQILTIDFKYILLPGLISYGFFHWYYFITVDQILFLVFFVILMVLSLFTPVFEILSLI